MGDIEDRRAAVTAGVSYPVSGADPKIEPGNGAAGGSYQNHGVTVRFGVGGKRRRSNLIAWIKPEAFPLLGAAMMEASPHEAELAFLSAMLKKRKKRRT
jgi:hypothetical protein